MSCGWITTVICIWVIQTLFWREQKKETEELMTFSDAQS